MANIGAGSSGNNLRGAISSNSSRGSNRNNRMRDGGSYNNRSVGRGGSGAGPYRSSSGTGSNVMSFQGQNNQQSPNIPQQLPDDGGHFWMNNSTATTAMTQYFLNNVVNVKTNDGRCYEGILQGYVCQNELCLTHALELEATASGLARPVNRTANKVICIPMKDIVCMSALNVPEDEVLDTIAITSHSNVPAGGDGFTDEAVRNKALLNSRSQLSTACDLQEFDLEIDESSEMLDDLNLDECGTEGGTWSAEAMFSALPNRRSADGSSALDFESTFETKYSSVPINLTENFQERLRRAEQLSREIIATNYSAGNLELENQESEEARFSAVVHGNDRIDERPAGSTANPRAGTVPAIRGPTLPVQALSEVNGGGGAPSAMSNPSEQMLVKDRSAKVDNLKKFSENFKLKSKDTPLPPPIPKEQRNTRASRPAQPVVVKASSSPSNASQSVADQLPGSINEGNHDASDTPPCSTPPGSTASTEDDIPRSNLNPDAFEFKPRFHQQQPQPSQVDVEMSQLAPSAVLHCPPDNYVTQTSHFIQPTQQSIMMIPQQYHYSAGGQTGGVAMQSHNTVAAQSPGSMSVYPQMLPYAAQHAVQHQGAAFSSQGVTHHPGMYIIPVQHAPQPQQQQMVSQQQMGSQQGVSATPALKVLNQQAGGGSNSGHKASAPLRQQAGVVNLGLNGHATAGSHQVQQTNPHQSAAAAQQMLVTGPPIMMSGPHPYFQQQQQQQQLLRQHSQHTQQQQSQMANQEYASSGQGPVHMFYQNSYQLEALQRHQQLHGHRQTPPGVSANPAAVVATANANNPSASASVVQQQHIVPPPPVSTPQGMSFPVATMHQQMQWNAMAAQQQIQWAAQQHYSASQYQPVPQQHHVAYMNPIPPHATQHQQHFFHAPYGHPQSNYAMSQQMMSQQQQQQQQQLSSQGPSGQ